MNHLRTHKDRFKFTTNCSQNPGSPVGGRDIEAAFHHHLETLSPEKQAVLEELVSDLTIIRGMGRVSAIEILLKLGFFFDVEITQRGE